MATIRTSRVDEQRKRTWKPPARLDTPAPPPGYKYRWVRHELRGEAHDFNVYARTRQWYEPVRPEELGGFESEIMEDGKHTGVVRSGDLILMKVPEEIVKQRTEYFDGMADRMHQAVSTELKKESRKEMPIEEEVKSTVTFGSSKEVGG